MILTVYYRAICKVSQLKASLPRCNWHYYQCCCSLEESFEANVCAIRYCPRPRSCQSLKLVHKPVISLYLKASRAANGWVADVLNEDKVIKIPFVVPIRQPQETSCNAPLFSIYCCSGKALVSSPGTQCQRGTEEVTKNSVSSPDFIPPSRYSCFRAASYCNWFPGERKTLLNN